MRPNNLNDPSRMQRDIIKAQRIQAVTALVGSTSVNEGALRIASEEGLIVEGSAKVSGTLQVTGTLNANGTINLSGATFLTGDLAIGGGGKLTLGAATLSPTAAGGDPGLGSTDGLGLKAVSAITIDAPSVLIGGTVSLASIWSSLPETSLPGNVRCDPLTGKFSRSTA